jgi:uncharacterized protein (TIGR03083 family)
VHSFLTFRDHLRLINERSTAFRAAVAAAPSLDLRVPTHPERTLFDLVQHVGMGRRKTTAVVAAGPADAPPDTSAWDDGVGAPRERDALLDWWTESVEQLTSVLREAGPDRGCWTWWGDCDSPQTSGAWARRQVPEIAVHTYDAQLTIGEPQPLPEEVAVDGVEEFLFTCNATTSPWPHEPAVLVYTATEGRSWALRLSEKGARAERLSGPGEADLVAVGTASDIVLTIFGRADLDVLKFEGDMDVLHRLIAWEPE